MLNSAGAAKLAVVKEVKNLLGIGLKDAKGLVDDAPSVIKEGVDKAEAESIKAALEGAGADVSSSFSVGFIVAFVGSTGGLVGVPILSRLPV